MPLFAPSVMTEREHNTRHELHSASSLASLTIIVIIDKR
jgi:hypothetical protein